MLGLTSEPKEQIARWTDNGREKQSALAECEEEKPAAPSLGSLIAAAAVLGLGFLAWTYFGPELRGYMKTCST